MIDVNKLLKKKRWTGSELGRLQIADTLKAFENTSDTNTKKMLISREDFRKMLDTLDDPKEIQIYNGYIAIHEWFRISYTGAAAEEQAAHLNFLELEHALTNAVIAEDICGALLKMPVIITQEDYDKQDKPKTGNVAVLTRTPDAKNGFMSPLIIKENEISINPEIHTCLSQISLEGYFETKENTDNIDYIKTARRRLLKSYYYLKGWNEALKLIAEEFDIEEILIAQMNIKNLNEKISRYNQKVKLLDEKIKASEPSSKELKKKKLKVLKNILSPISFDSIIIPEEKIMEAKKSISDFDTFKDNGKDIRRILCYAT